MNTIDQLLQQAYREPDTTTVQLTMTVPLGLLRQQHDLFSALPITLIEAGDSSVQTDEAVSAEVTEAPAQPAPARPSAKPKTIRRAAKRVPAKVTMQTVSKAMAAGHTTPLAIAQVVKATPKAVASALSRYVRQGLVERVEVGQYRLLEDKDTVPESDSADIGDDA